MLEFELQVLFWLQPILYYALIYYTVASFGYHLENGEVNDARLTSSQSFLYLMWQ